MIVVGHRFGQLGNRLILSAHLMAAAREYGVGLSNLAFAEYAHLFQGTASDLWCRFPCRAISSKQPIYRHGDYLRNLLNAAGEGCGRRGYEDTPIFCTGCRMMNLVIWQARNSLIWSEVEDPFYQWLVVSLRSVAKKTWG